MHSGCFATMNEEQLKVAGEIVDELISLGVLQLPPKDRKTLANATLFVVPKPGQPGQLRCIADMLRGGQYYLFPLVYCVHHGTV